VILITEPPRSLSLRVWLQANTSPLLGHLPLELITTGTYAQPHLNALIFFLHFFFSSYSQLILRPYGWSTQLPPNEATAKLVGDGIRDQIRAVHNVAYTSEPSWQLYYTAGTAQDWFYSGGKIPLAYHSFQRAYYSCTHFYERLPAFHHFLPFVVVFLLCLKCL